MDILIVHEVDYVHKPYFEFQEFSEGLSARGHRVTVLHVQKYTSRVSKKLEPVVDLKRSHFAESMVKLYSTKFVVRGPVSRVLSIFDHLRLLLKIVLRQRPQVVFSYSVPTSGVTVAIVGKIFRIPVIHRSIDVSHLLRARLLSPIVRISEIITYRLSNSISTHNMALKSYIENTNCHKIAVSIDYPPVDPTQALVKTEEKKDADTMRLLFIGTLAHFTDLESIFRSIHALPLAHNLKLRIVGSGPKEDKLRRLSKTLGLGDRIEFRGWRDREEIADELAWANIGIVPFRKNLLTDCALPQKAIEYMSSGLSVVSTRLQGTESVLGEFRGMYFVESSAHIIGRCRDLARSGKSSVVDADLVARKFSRESSLESIENLLLETIRLENP